MRTEKFPVWVRILFWTFMVLLVITFICIVCMGLTMLLGWLAGPVGEPTGVIFQGASNLIQIVKWSWDHPWVTLAGLAFLLFAIWAGGGRKANNSAFHK